MITAIRAAKVILGMLNLLESLICVLSDGRLLLNSEVTIIIQWYGLGPYRSIGAGSPRPRAEVANEGLLVRRCPWATSARQIKSPPPAGTGDGLGQEKT